MINHYELAQQARERAEIEKKKEIRRKALDIRVAAEAVARCIGNRGDELNIPVDVAEVSWDIEQDLKELIDSYVPVEDNLLDGGTEYVLQS